MFSPQPSNSNITSLHPRETTQIWSPSHTRMFRDQLGYQTRMSNLDVPSCGEMRVVSSSESGVDFEWTPIFNSLSDDRKEHCTSPVIRAKGNFWYFDLYPNDYDVHNQNWIGLFLCKIGRLERDVQFAVTRKLAGETEGVIVSKQIFPRRKSRVRVLFLLPRFKLLMGESKLNLTGQLTITCKLWTDEQPALEGERFFTLEATADSLAVRSAKEEERSHLSPEGSTPSQSYGKHIVDFTLQKHLKDLLITGDDHDVTIQVGNQKFKAHKCMLRSRSPVFAAMFKHKMTESEDGSITIDDCEPDAFSEFLNYVYTGKVEDLSPRKATGLYYAGDKYDFSGLKELCVQFLESSLSTTSICDVINLATRHSEKDLLESAIKFFSENTKEILITVEWQRFSANNSVAANELFLRAIGIIEKKK